MATFFCEFDAQEILSPCPEKKNFIGREIKFLGHQIHKKRARNRSVLSILALSLSKRSYEAD
jgi:hypothetical protein